MSDKSHWDKIYSSKNKDEMSWTQSSFFHSREFIKKTGLKKDAKIIDVGSGISVFPRELLAEKFCHLTVMDISAEALARSKKQLGPLSNEVIWIEGDITSAVLPFNEFDLWHDRAVFHFLKEPQKRDHYVTQARRALKPGGFLILATFGIEGPQKCSGLEIVRYTAATLQEVWGQGFQLKESKVDTHFTPWNTSQQFLYCLFQKP